MQRDHMHTDVMVIGSGIAGLQAAFHSAQGGARTCLFCKGIPAKTSASYVAGGVAVACEASNREDCPDIHFSDTVLAGAFLNDQTRLRILVEEGPEIFADLIRRGAQFDWTSDGDLVQKPRGGHSRNRFCTRHGDKGGQEISLLLLKLCKEANVAIYSDFLITKLLVYDGIVSGAIGLDLRTGIVKVIHSKATILATGGAGRVYPVSSMPAELSGDGYSLAFQAGATLLDMEMVQFHPGGLYVPGIVRGALVREPAHFAGLGGCLRNVHGESFMERYDARAEMATRDVVTRAEYLEIQGGRGSANGGIYLDLSGLSRQDREALPRTSSRFFATCMIGGIDPRHIDLIEIGPTVHYFMGGVKTDEHGSTTLPGLYACGEVVGGLHGANRLSGNAIAETMVFGARAGRRAAEYAFHSLETPPAGLQDMIASELQRYSSSVSMKEITPSPRPIAIEAQLQQMMWERVGVVRNETDLQGVLNDIISLRAAVIPFEDAFSCCTHKRYNRELISSFEINTLFCVAEMIVRCALVRKESRGAHYRSDFPVQDDGNWLVHTAIDRGEERPLIWSEPVDLEQSDTMKTRGTRE